MSSQDKIIIAIDGYSSSGKSTMARHLAAQIGYRYIDSGAMYRAVTLYAMRHGMVSPTTPPDIAAIVEALPDIHIDFKVMPDGTQLTELNGEVVETEIRGLEVSECVSPVAAIPEVRHDLVRMQREMGRDKGIVMDGRDIGTAVFPDAELKIFVNASAEKRAERRFKELTEKGQKVTYEEILDNVQSRDHIDETRKESPLRRAEDAILLDNSEMSREEQNSILLQLYNKAIGK
ncbi:MAG: (d)CMP kinase [Muribaculaceae bacterium]|nr:(d)CMP kinase [Muribaculaceae bacterium]